MPAALTAMADDEEFTVVLRELRLLKDLVSELTMRVAHVEQAVNELLYRSRPYGGSGRP